MFCIHVKLPGNHMVIILIAVIHSNVSIFKERRIRITLGFRNRNYVVRNYAQFLLPLCTITLHSEKQLNISEIARNFP